MTDCTQCNGWPGGCEECNTGPPCPECGGRELRSVLGGCVECAGTGRRLSDAEWLRERATWQGLIDEPDEQTDLAEWVDDLNYATTRRHLTSAGRSRREAVYLATLDARLDPLDPRRLAAGRALIVECLGEDF